MRLTRPFDLPALGRRQSVYSVSMTWHRPVFLINSRKSRFSAAIESSAGKPLHPQWRSLSRSYGEILPSSLTMVLSSALGYSPYPPVSVSGTDGQRLTRSFSWKSLEQVRAEALPITSEDCCCGFSCSVPAGLDRHNYPPACLNLSVTPSCLCRRKPVQEY